MEVRAPGRVNLIGEHTDYSDGWCLPLAIDRECRIRHTPTTERVVRARSAELPGTVEVPLDGPAPPAGAPLGPLRGRRDRRWSAGSGHEVAGADLAVHSTVPAGAGLSSSTALSVALVLALLPPDAPERADRDRLARLALAAEVAATGVPGGLLDQMASLYGRAGHALLLDCRALTVEPVPIPADLAILVVHSGIARELADSEYAARRAACEAAAARIGVPALRDATPDQVADDPIARHVVTENARVLECATALAAGDLDAVGPILLAGHASLRDDFARLAPRARRSSWRPSWTTAPSAPASPAPASEAAWSVSPRPTGADECLAATLADYRARTGRRATGFRVTAGRRAGRHCGRLARARRRRPGPSRPHRSPHPRGEFPAQGLISVRRCNWLTGPSGPRAPARGSEDDRSARDSAPPARMTRVTWCVVGVGLVWLIAHALGLLGPLTPATFPLLSIGAVVAIVVGVRGQPARRRAGPWYSLAAAMALFFVGGIARESMDTLGVITSSRSHRPGPHHDPRLLPRRRRVLRHRARPPARPRQRDRHAARRRGLRPRRHGPRLAVPAQPDAARSTRRCRCA